MILNKAQAEAGRDAICALNNVGMVADIYLPQHDYRRGDLCGRRRGRLAEMQCIAVHHQRTEVRILTSMRSSKHTGWSHESTYIRRRLAGVAVQVTALAATAVAAFNNQQEKTMTSNTHHRARTVSPGLSGNRQAVGGGNSVTWTGSGTRVLPSLAGNAARQYRRKQEPKKFIRIGDALVPAPIREASVESYLIVSSTLNVRCVYVGRYDLAAGTQQSFFDSGMAYATEADAQRQPTSA